MSTGWPLVDVHDDGIRPAGRTDECFYCRQSVGSPHLRDCVAVHKRVELRVLMRRGREEEEVAFWDEEVPADWDAAMIEFARNESSWCASNWMDAPKSEVRWVGCESAKTELAEFAEREECLCNVLRFEYVRDTNPVPYRKIRLPGEPA